MPACYGGICSSAAIALWPARAFLSESGCLCLLIVSSLCAAHCAAHVLVLKQTAHRIVRRTLSNSFLKVWRSSFITPHTFFCVLYLFVYDSETVRTPLRTSKSFGDFLGIRGWAAFAFFCSASAVASNHSALVQTYSLNATIIQRCNVFMHMYTFIYFSFSPYT